MNCVSQNYRGLGNPQTEDELVALVTTKDPKIVFLMETKAKKYILERVGRRIQFTNLFVVPRVNTGGGLALFWKSDLDVDVQTFSTNHINAIVNQRVDDAWRFTGFYEDPDTANRENSWDLLRANLICLGFAWAILMKFCLQTRRWDGWIGQTTNAGVQGCFGLLSPKGPWFQWFSLHLV